MITGTAPWKTVFMFVPLERIQPCTVDVEQQWSGGFSYLHDCHYLKEERLYAVQVRMSTGYPNLENGWLEKWNVKGPS